MPKRAGARTRTWTVALTDAEWTLAEAVRAQYGGNWGMSRADLVMSWVLPVAERFKDKRPVVAAALDDLDEERFEDREANRIDHGGRDQSPTSRTFGNGRLKLTDAISAAPGKSSRSTS